MSVVPMSPQQTSRIFRSFFDEDESKQYILNLLYPTGYVCQQHHRICTIVKRKDGRWQFQCAVSETSFAKSKMKVGTILQILFQFYIHTTQRQCQLVSGASKQTISRYYSLCSSALCSQAFDTFEPIGGAGVVVQVDECIFRRRKAHRGHPKQQIWIFGGVEMLADGKQGRLFVTRVPNRTAQTLWGVIRNCIKINSTIWSDEWSGYQCLSRTADYQHLTVNHSITFRDPDSGVNTNMIEGVWHQLRSFLPRNGVRTSQLDQKLGSFNGFKDLQLEFDEFVRLVSSYHYDDQEDQVLPEIEPSQIEDVPIIGELVDDSDSDILGLTDGLEDSEYMEK